MDVADVWDDDPDKEVPLSELGNLGKQLNEISQKIENSNLGK